MSFDFNILEWKELRTYIIYIFCGVFGGLAQVVTLRQVKFIYAVRAIVSGGFIALVIGLLSSITNWPKELVYALCLLGGFGGTLTICYIFTIVLKRTGGDLGQLAKDARTFYTVLSEVDGGAVDGKQTLFRAFTENRVTKEQYSQLIINDKSCLVSLLEDKKITASEFETINATIF